MPNQAHPVYQLLEKTALTELERVALYGVMNLATHEGWGELTIEQVWDKMLAEYESIKAMAAFEGVPEDKSGEIDPNSVPNDAKRHNLLVMRPATKQVVGYFDLRR